MFKKVACLLLCIAMLFSLTSCFEQDYNENAVITVDFNSLPKTLDPQLASTDSELIVVHNLFEGLMRYTREGELECGAAESYKQEDKTYTFTLRDGLKWDNGDPVTAQDFVFGMQRAVDPKTCSPGAKDLFFIRSAERIVKGQMEPSQLGVTAKDKKTLVINLERDDKNVLASLTKAAFMPCNQKAFEKCNGQYGLNKDSVVGNGSYKLKTWDTDAKTIKLSRSVTYAGEYKAQNSAVVITNSDKDNISLLESGKVDTVLFNFDEYNKVNETYNCRAKQNTIWYLMINKNDPSLSERAIRESFLTSIDREKLEPVLKENSMATKKNMLPWSVSKKIKPSLTSSALQFNASLAASKYSQATALNGKVSEYKLLYIESEAMKNVCGKLASDWQETLGAVINTETVSSLSELESRISAGKYQMALVPVTASTTKPDDFMQKFTSGNIYGFESGEYDMIANSLDTIIVDDERHLVRRAIINAQTTLFADLCIFPIAGSRNGIASGEKIVRQNFRVVPGHIDFAYFRKA